MQQRRLRLGDVIDDYCPRERRITNHAVVAMIEDTVKQTRCTTCDADHEYKHAKTPATRRKKTVAPVGKLVAPEAEELHEEMTALGDVPESDESGAVESGAEIGAIETSGETSSETGEQVEQSEQQEQTELATAAPADEAVESEEVTSDDEKDNWPVHRPLIRAQLPRPEGHTPERKAPDFTFRPAGGRFDQNRNNGQRHRGGGGPHRQGGGGRQAHGGQPGQGGSRFGGQRGPGGHGGGGPQGQRHGSNRPGQGGGGNRPGQGQGRGPRPGGGRKRGR